jgi:ribosomal protein S18 acetylase RimI-like enzyme
MADVVIREAAPEEWAVIEHLVKEAYQEFQPLMPEHAWNSWMDNISREVHSGAGVLLAAARQGERLGVVKFLPDASQSTLGQWPPGAGTMRILAVRPQARGRGVGHLLVKECLTRAGQLKLPGLFLYTGTFMQAARHIYEKLGFARAPEYDRHPGPIAYHLQL